jgi:hypothetical protein
VRNAASPGKGIGVAQFGDDDFRIGAGNRRNKAKYSGDQYDLK